MTNLLIILHVAVCFFLVVIVLLQQGKGANMGATFGGSSQTVFGSEGPLPLLNKVTTIAAITFMVTSITLAYLSAHKSSSSVMKDLTQPPPKGSGIERSAKPLPEKERPDMPLIPAEPAAPPAPPAADQTGKAPDAGVKQTPPAAQDGNAALPAPSPAQPQTGQAEKKAETPAPAVPEKAEKPAEK